MPHYTTYWKDDQVTRNVGTPLTYAASEQFSKVQKGDVVWIVNIQKGTGAFRLIGKIAIDAVLDDTGMRRRYPGESFYDASLFACAPKGKEELGRVIPIDFYATQIRFEGPSPTLELRDGKVYPQQVRSLRTLTAESAELFEDIWREHPGEDAPPSSRLPYAPPAEVRPRVFWWVNQNQTARHEIGGGYMWSPKRNKNGARNAYYENMRECAPGDVVFSFVDSQIKTMGVVTAFCEQSPRPDEFGNTGDQIRPTLPEKYSPLQADGRGNQIYLARLPQPMADALISLIGRGAAQVVQSADAVRAGCSPESPLVEQRNDSAEATIKADANITETEKQALVRSRRGQGVFRERVAALEPRCRITGVANRAYLIASHIKPWACCSNRERLDPHNGLLLAPHIDHLFDNGFISFTDDGALLISPVADHGVLEQMGVPVTRSCDVGTFTEKQKEYLAYHRDEVFKQAATSRT